MQMLNMQSLLSRCQAVRQSSRTRRGKSPNEERVHVPHPLPKDYAGMTCPITGLSADGLKNHEQTSAVEAFAALEADPDIAEERRVMEQAAADSGTPTAQPRVSSSRAGKPPREHQEQIRLVPLNVINRSHKSSSDTRRLFRDAGGLPMMRKMTDSFYQKCFVDPHLDQFLRRHEDAHGERFSSWIAEKFGDGTPWTNERKTRKQDVMQIGHHVKQVSFDRSSAHFAAWHSPKRAPDKWGQHFKPDDARNWMRLHFWAARDVGLFEPEHAAFMDYYTRFIGHFISIYSSKSPPFTRESARWSEDPKNIERYMAAGNLMVDVHDVPVEKALLGLPASERPYTGSASSNPAWPYELSSRI